MSATVDANMPADAASRRDRPADSSAPVAAVGQRSLLGLSRTEIGAALGEIGVAPSQQRMRAAQLWGWIYGRGATDFGVMSNIAKDLRGALGQSFDPHGRNRHRADCATARANGCCGCATRAR